MYSMRLVCVPRLECGMCRQMHDIEHDADDHVAAAFFGAAPYEFCAFCSRRVPKRKQTKRYRAAWDAVVADRRAFLAEQACPTSSHESTLDRG